MTGLEPIWIGAAAKGLTDIVVKPVSEVLNRRLDEPFQQILFDVFRKYIQNYTDRHGLLKVLGMPEPARLENIYTAVQFLNSQTMWQFDPNCLEEAYRESRERRFQSEQCDKQDGLKVANEQKYLVVLGQPGAGKSTFLRRIGLEALKGEAGGYRNKCIPVFLELKQFRTGEVNLEKAIAHEFEICGFPNSVPSTQKLLASGKLLILLDGLDEVPTQQLYEAIEKIQDFADKYKQNRFIASCRTAAYQSRFRKFVDVTMADFDKGQIQQFIGNWFRTAKDAQSETAQRCWHLLKTPKHAGTRELAQTPLLLTLLCLVYDDTQDFPERRADLYKQALDVLLTKWAAEKRIQRDPIYKDLTLTLEIIMLGEIAYLGFTANRLFFSQQEVVNQIREFLASNLNAPNHLDGEEILQAIQIQQGILVERAKNVLSFSHLTVQEYLSAQYIVDQDRADKPLISQLLKEYFIENRWREVWLLVAGLMRGGSDPLLLEMEKQAQTYLVTPKLQALINWVEQKTQDSESDLHPLSKRTLLVFLVVDLTHTRFYAQSRLGTSPTLANALSLALDLVVILLPDDTCILDQLIPTSRNLARDRHLPNVLSNALSNNLDRALTFEKTNILKTVDWSDLTSQLRLLDTIWKTTSSFSEAYLSFFNQVSFIWINALFLNPEWLNLSEMEIRAFHDYLYANELILQCKKSALRISPQIWTDIEERMLTLKSLPNQDLNNHPSFQRVTRTPQPNPPPLTNSNVNMHFHGPTYGVAGIVQDDQNIHPTE
jgi:hypothetical protein